MYMNLLKDVASFIFPSRASRELYNEWSNNNRLFYSKIINILGILLLAVMIGIGFVTFSEEIAISYARIRSLGIMLSFVMLFSIFYLQDKPSKYRAFWVGMTILIPSVLLTYQYYYYLFTASEKPFSILFGNLIVIMGIHLLLCRLRGEHLFYTIFSVVALVGVGLIPATQNTSASLVLIGSEGYKDLARILIEAQIGFYLATHIVIGNKHVADLHKNFNNLRRLVPLKIARFMTVNNMDINKDDAFVPIKRKIVCISSDWRNFQSLAQNSKNETISMLFEVYYELVYEILERTIPEGNYYWDWIADELFLVVYDENDDEEKILKQSVNFANELSLGLQNKIKERLDMDIIFDIGMSYGVNLFGIMGPNYRRKTTVAGDLPGNAKRYEQEAKAIRAQSKVMVVDDGHIKDLNKPIVVMDSYIEKCTEKLGLFDDAQNHIAQGKNIKGRDIRVFFHKKTAA